MAANTPALRWENEPGVQQPGYKNSEKKYIKNNYSQPATVGNSCL